MLLVGFFIACCWGVYCYLINQAIEIGLACALGLTLVNWLWLLYPAGFIREGLKFTWLAQRGVITEGKVIAHEKRAGGRYSRAYQVSVLLFKTLTSHPIQCKVDLNTIEPIGSKHTVIYDPANPHKNARAGDRPTAKEIKRAIVLPLLASLPFVAIMFWCDIVVANIKV